MLNTLFVRRLIRTFLLKSTNGDQRTMTVKRNISLSFLYKAVSIIISFITIPLTIKYLDPSKFGVWITLSSIIAWFSLFDVGLGNGLRNKFTEAKTRGEYDLIRIYVSTTYFYSQLIDG